MRRNNGILALVAVLALAAAACGDDDDEADAAETDTGQAADTDEGDTAEPDTAADTAGDIADEEVIDGEDQPPWAAAAHFDTRFTYSAIWSLGDDARAAVATLVDQANTALSDAGSAATLSWPAHNADGDEMPWAFCSFRDAWTVASTFTEESSFRGPICGVFVDDTQAPTGMTLWALFSLTTLGGNVDVEQTRTATFADDVEAVTVARTVTVDGDTVVELSGDWVRDTPVATPSADIDVYAKVGDFRFPLEGDALVTLFELFTRRIEFPVVNLLADPPLDRREGAFTLTFTNLPSAFQGIFSDPDNTLLRFGERWGNERIVPYPAPEWDGFDPEPPWANTVSRDTRTNYFALWSLGEDAQAAVVPLVEAANTALADAGSDAVLSWPSTASGSDRYWAWCAFRNAWVRENTSGDPPSFRGPVCGVLVDDTGAPTGSTYWALVELSTTDDGVTVEQTRTDELASDTETVTADYQTFVDGDRVAHVAGEWTLEAPVTTPASDADEDFGWSADFRFPTDQGIERMFQIYTHRIQFDVVNRFADPAIDRTEGDLTVELTNLPAEVQAVFDDPDNTLLIFRDRFGDELVIEVTDE
jgi:hypothetical protein